jgi:hypothetical protein
LICVTYPNRLNEEPYHTMLRIENPVYYWEDWSGVFNTSVDFYNEMPPAEFRQGFREVLLRVAKIHVNLEGVEDRFNLDDYYDLLDEDELEGLINRYAFAWELWVIRNDLDACSRTTFYLSGSSTPSIERGFTAEFCR